VIAPISFILGIAFHARKYVRGVADYLAAGRLAGRYILTIGDMTAALGLINLVSLVEIYRRSGFAVGFWQISAIIVSTVMAMSGFCIYRFRQSKALSNGQFLEMRYSRKFRILASATRILAEMIANSLGPAISAMVFMYLLGIPSQFTVAGFAIPTYPLLVGGLLMLSLSVILPGGRIGLYITDAIQGIFCYPIFILLVGYILITFSWFGQVVPVLTDRVPGESFLNPFDIENLRDFNIVFVFIIIFGGVYNRASWMGNDSTIAGRTPHEQKMANMLGVWRYGLGTTMTILIGVAVVVGMNHKDFATEAHHARQELSMKADLEVTKGDEELLARVQENIGAIPPLKHDIGVDAPMSQEENLDTVYLDAAHEGFGDTPKGNQLFQKFKTIYSQMMLPASFRQMLPTGLLGVFCLLGIMLMVTTDDSRLINASSAIIQDLVIPLRKKGMPPQQHLRYVKWCTVGVALFFYTGAMLLTQLDYIQMFVAIVLALWLGGAAPVMVFGLYSRFGNTVGAYCSLIFGSSTALGGILIQRGWATVVYPFLENHGWVESVGWFLGKVSGPLNPYVVWEMNPVKAPVNSMETYFIAMMLATIAYVTGSLLSSRKSFNLDRLLHRGKYNIDGVEETKSAWTFRSMWGKLIGITADYTRGDKIIAWGIFAYIFVYQCGFAFLLVVVWNSFSPWPVHWWGNYYFITYLVVTPIIGLITTVWFTWGGIRDIRQLFRDLAKRVVNPLDDGRVKGHVSLADIPLIGSDENDEDSAETSEKNL